MVHTTFNGCWGAICADLTPRPKLYCWTAVGRTSGYFRVERVGYDGVTVETKHGPRYVPRKDFQKLFVLWPDYRDGKIQRYKLNFVVNTTYVLAIFHWLE